MPKKGKKPEKPEQEEIKESEEAEEPEEHEEESKLEEELDDSNLNLQSLEFHQFMELSGEQESGTPVLERMALSAPRPIFVGGIPQNSAAAAREESGGEFKYISGAAENTEPKYLSEQGITAPERINFTQAGKAERTGSFREEISQERFFMQSEPKIESQSMERFERPERFDVERAGRENSPKRSEAKYEKYRPKLPKS